MNSVFQHSARRMRAQIGAYTGQDARILAYIRALNALPENEQETLYAAMTTLARELPRVGVFIALEIVGTLALRLAAADNAAVGALLAQIAQQET